MSRSSNAQFSYAFFGFNAFGHSSQITPYYLKLYFAVGVFFQVPPSNKSKTPLFRTLVYYDLYKFN